ncbi:hypothetical protein D9757_004291 [Collybiopsis confluens]|uniref:Uncharacterized protein n=1 Tax=Collybiopsis confluens TaxID=2823264 RepID=A0A8H5HU43_9AGAR|nr:hypothetical protein D9757_004291 [Collybiopsis confluens]
MLGATGTYSGIYWRDFVEDEDWRLRATEMTGLLFVEPSFAEFDSEDSKRLLVPAHSSLVKTTLGKNSWKYENLPADEFEKISPRLAETIATDPAQAKEGLIDDHFYWSVVITVILGLSLWLLVKTT